MTDRFDKFMEWSYLDDNCRRRIVEDAPEHIKEEAKKVNEEYYQRTGIYVLHIDY